MQPVDPPVNADVLPASPGFPQHRRQANLTNLFSNIEFAQAIRSAFVVVETVEHRAMFVPDAGNRLKPLLNRSSRVARENGAYAPASVVPADDHVLDPENVNRILKHGDTIQIGWRNDVGDIPMDEHFARTQADDLVRRHSTVRTPDPQVTRRLLCDEIREESRIVVQHRLRPSPIVVEQVLRLVHADGPYEEVFFN